MQGLGGEKILKPRPALAADPERLHDARATAGPATADTRHTLPRGHCSLMTAQWRNGAEENFRPRSGYSAATAMSPTVSIGSPASNAFSSGSTLSANSRMFRSASSGGMPA
jgi:hypothetical protein